MPNCCVVYTTDNTYLFPTFVSASQARRNCSPEKADVIIFCLGLSDEVEHIFAPICAHENIGLVRISSEIVEGQTAMLSRLFMNRFVPAEYTQYLYMDGDVQILDSIDPLLETAVPENSFLAANDPITFLLADSGTQSQDLSKHMEAIGLTREQSHSYFNSGVLRINRQGWDKIGMDAWEYYQRNGGPSRFPDQDALNIVAVDKHLPMSLAWNFPIFMRNSRVESEIKPRITHFMSSPKPWHGSFPPWTREACKPYEEAISTYPALAAFSIVMPLRKQMIYHFQQRAKKIMETFTWGFSERRGRILTYEASCQL